MSGASSLSEYGKQLGAFSILVIVQSFAILLFKLCQVGGKYTFNPASSVALTEVCKLGLAGTLHYRYTVSERKPFFEHVNLKIVLHYFGLSALYTVNNQLSFYCLEVADPGSMALGKSIAPYLCALLLRLAGQHLHALQWVCVVVQCCAIAIVQYDACKGTGYLPTKAYYMIGLATSITAVTSVWNQLIIKGFEVPVNLQNAIMYAFGSVIATVSYVHSAAATATRAITSASSRGTRPSPSCWCSSRPSTASPSPSCTSTRTPSSKTLPTPRSWPSSSSSHSTFSGYRRRCTPGWGSSSS
jgi:UDP-sugar transporter A1/2/3